MRKREAENVASSADGHVLHAINRIGHGGCADSLASIEVPESGAGRCFNCLTKIGIVRKYHQSAGGCECPPPGVTRPHLRITPSRFSIRHGKRQQNLLRAFIGRKLRAGIVVSLALDELFRARKEETAALKSHDMEEPGVGIVGRRKPIRGAVDAWADKSAFSGRYSTRQKRSAGGVHALGPVQFVHEGGRAQEPAIGPVEYIEKTIPVRLY